MSKFVSVVGITNLEQFKQIHVPDTIDRNVYVGLLINPFSCIEGITQDKKRYIQKEQLLDIYRYHQMDTSKRFSQIRLVVHYCPGVNRDYRSHLEFLRGGNFGWQLNIANINHLKKVHTYITTATSAVEPNFVFQLNRTMKEKYGPVEMCMFFKALATERDYILYDMSGGHGKALTLDEARQFIDRTNGIDINFAFAGGLSPSNVAMAAFSLGMEYSYDAESGLRDGNDELDLDKVNRFIEVFS